ncbi:hypothetical protein [Flavobacterium sp.]|uniref:hypothetical protein n=1 Tax=Flavobacterium sp. TaxID=239 RepID=UPI0037533D3E
MKNLIIIALLLSLNSFAQTVLEKADGSKINVDWASFDNSDEKVTFKVGDKKEKLKFKELKSVISPYQADSKVPLANYTWMYFPNAKKFKGMYVKTETNDKLLGFVHYTTETGPSTTSANGTTFFNGSSSFEHVHLTVFDKQGTVLEDIDLRSGYQSHNIEERGEAIEMIKRQFSNCPNFIKDFTSFITAESDPKNLRVVEYFMQKIKVNHNNADYVMEPHNLINCN